MGIKVKVHSFESFGTVDGPGVRFVIFFQGCHLSCRYCHNRDLWQFDGGTDWTSVQLFNELKKYKTYFGVSGGGVTISGGEPLLQAAGAAALFRRCRAAGIHTALDTSGAVPITEEIEELLSVTDLVLLDIKQINSEKHRALTGLGNEHTLDFARYLSEKSIDTWIRYVVVPGVTDSSEECRALTSFVKTLPNVKKLELLAFHKMGEFKWEELGAEYTLRDTPVPSAEDMERVLSCFSELTIPVCSAKR